MADLEPHLRALFSERSVRRLAPAALLATGCGVALGGLLAAPAFAASGAGIVLGGIAVNIASSWLEQLAMLPIDDEQGLADRDPGALALTAAALAAAGPQFAAALPAEGRIDQTDANHARAIDKTDASHARAMELARVYIALDTTTAVETEQAADKGGGRDTQRPLSALEVLGHAPGARAMLLGVPGSGKSTFVSYLSYCLAGAALAARATADDWLALLPRWPYGALLLVPIVLRDLAVRAEAELLAELADARDE